MERAQARADSTRRPATKRLRGRPLRSAAVLVAAIVVGVVFSAGAQAAPGDLDPTFSGDGKQTTDFAGSDRRTGWRSRPTARSSRSAAPSGGTGDPGRFALARYNPNGSLDTSFSGDGKQTTDFGGGATGVALQGDGKIVAVGTRSRGDARLRARPLQPERLARPELLRRRQADDRLRRAASAASEGGDPGERQDRRGRRSDGARRLRARPLQPERLARPELLRGRQADDRLRRAPTRRPGWRSRRTARSSWSGRRPATPPQRLRARPLQPQRLARHELLRGRQADDRLRRPGASTSASGVAIQADGKIVAVGGAGGGSEPRRLRPRPLQHQRHARHELLRGRQADDRVRGGRPGKRGGAPGATARSSRLAAPAASAATSRSPATTPNGSLDPSFSGDGRQTTDFGGTDARPGWLSRATARSSPSAAASAPTEPAISRLLAIWAAEHAPVEARRHQLMRRTAEYPMGAAGFEPATSRV